MERSTLGSALGANCTAIELRGGWADGVEYFLELVVDRLWLIPTIPAVAIAVRVRRGYKDAHGITQRAAFVPGWARLRDE